MCTYDANANNTHGKGATNWAILIEALALTSDYIGEIYLTERTYDCYSGEHLICSQDNQPISDILQQNTS